MYVRSEKHVYSVVLERPTDNCISSVLCMYMYCTIHVCLCRYPQLMDQALQSALVELTPLRETSELKEEEDGEGGESGDGGDGVRWIHEFVVAALPGSRHQVQRN